MLTLIPLMLPFVTVVLDSIIMSNLTIPMPELVIKIMIIVKALISVAGLAMFDDTDDRNTDVCNFDEIKYHLI